MLPLKVKIGSQLARKSDKITLFLAKILRILASASCATTASPRRSGWAEGPQRCGSLLETSIVEGRPHRVGDRLQPAFHPSLDFGLPETEAAPLLQLTITSPTLFLLFDVKVPIVQTKVRWVSADQHARRPERCALERTDQIILAQTLEVEYSGGHGSPAERLRTFLPSWRHDHAVLSASRSDKPVQALAYTGQ